jgi:hypothetical protein
MVLHKSHNLPLNYGFNATSEFLAEQIGHIVTSFWTSSDPSADMQASSSFDRQSIPGDLHLATTAN